MHNIIKNIEPIAIIVAHVYFTYNESLSVCMSELEEKKKLGLTKSFKEDLRAGQNLHGDLTELRKFAH